MVEQVHYDSQTKNNNMIMIFSLVSGTFNTIIIPLVASADLRWYYGLNIVKTNGQFSDLSKEWYFNAGPLVIFSMATLCFMPLLNIFIVFALEQYKRGFDSGFILCPRKHKEKALLYYKTKVTTKAKYINMYAGPEYALHSAYASVILMVFMTFIYGLFLPIMFPLCCLGIYITLSVEPAMLSYIYKKPANYGDKMDIRAVQLLKLAPIAMFSFGYWAFSNPQLFDNDPPNYFFINKAADPEHSVY